MRGESHPREPTVAGAKRSRAEAMRRIFFLASPSHRFYPERPRRNGERSTAARKRACNRREFAKVERLVGEKSRQGRFHNPTACVLRLALTSGAARKELQAIILKRDSKATRSFQDPATSQRFSPIVCSMAFHRCGTRLVACLADPHGGPLD